MLLTKMKYEVPTVKSMANIITVATIPATPLLVRLDIFIQSQSVWENVTTFP